MFVLWLLGFWLMVAVGCWLLVCCLLRLVSAVSRYCGLSCQGLATISPLLTLFPFRSQPTIKAHSFFLSPADAATLLAAVVRALKHFCTFVSAIAEPKIVQREEPTCRQHFGLVSLICIFSKSLEFHAAHFQFPRFSALYF